MTELGVSMGILLVSWMLRLVFSACVTYLKILPENPHDRSFVLGVACGLSLLTAAEALVYFLLRGLEWAN